MAVINDITKAMYIHYSLYSHLIKQCVLPVHKDPLHGSSSTASPAHSVVAQERTRCRMYTLLTRTTFHEVQSCHTPYTATHNDVK